MSYEVQTKCLLSLYESKWAFKYSEVERFPYGEGLLEHAIAFFLPPSLYVFKSYTWTITWFWLANSGVITS